MTPAMAESMQANFPVGRLLQLPTTSRQAWILLAVAVAINNITISFATQGSENSVLVTLLWVGAFLCIEDNLTSLKTDPNRIGMVLGSLLLTASFWRSAIMYRSDAVAFLLPSLQAFGLALLLAQPKKIWQYRSPILILSFMPISLLISKQLPINELSLLTAKISGSMISLAGENPLVIGNQIWLPGGGVIVGGPCSGSTIIIQLFAAALIFTTAYPPKHLWLKISALSITPVIAITINSTRVAILTLINASKIEEKQKWFDFFHKEEGSLVFAAISMTIFSIIYLKIIEKETKND